MYFQGKCAKVPSINDKKDFVAVKNALKVIDFTDSQIDVSSFFL